MIILNTTHTTILSLKISLILDIFGRYNLENSTFLKYYNYHPT